MAASKSSNFRSAARWRGRENLLPRSRRKSRSVSASRKLRIMHDSITLCVNNVKRYADENRDASTPRAIRESSYAIEAILHPLQSRKYRRMLPFGGDRWTFL